jgi:Protein of unknown function (DUF4230)
VAGTAIFLWETVRKFDFFKSTSRIEHNVVLQEVTALGNLELARFSFRDVVEHELVQPFLPNPKALLIVQGEAIGCIDLSKIQEKDIKTTGDSLLINLPKPTICVYKINHQKTKIYDVRFAVFREQELIGEAYKQAEAQLQKSAIETGILEQTRQNAETILKPILERISKKKVFFVEQP